MCVVSIVIVPSLGGSLGGISHYFTVFMVRLHPSGRDPQKRIPAAVAVLSSTILGSEDAMESTIPIEVLDAEFFDGESIIVVYRRRNQVGRF